MIFRHPHVFGEGADKIDAKTVSERWELRKRQEGGGRHILDGVPESAPSMLKAMQMQRKARDVGFDWEERAQVWDKVREEMGELENELRSGDRDKAEGEVGDLLFAVINAARLYDIDPEVALSRTCAKFRRRFTYLEDHTLREGRKLTDLTLAEMDAIWDECKSREK